MAAVPRMWRSENDTVELILSFHFCRGPGTGTQTCPASAFTQLSQLARPGFVKRFFFFICWHVLELVLSSLLYEMLRHLTGPEMLISY